VNPLSLLFLNPLGERDWGGVETWMLAVAKGLAARGHAITGCARRGSRFLDRFAEQGFSVETLAFRRDFGPLDILKLRRIQRRRSVRAIVTKLDRGIRAAGLASALGGGAAVVMRQGLFEVKDGFRHRFAYRWVDRVITPARSIRERILETGVLAEDRVDHVPNGVDADRFARDGAKGRAFRERMEIPDGPLLVNTSRLHDQKGHDVLLDAFATLAGAPRLVLAGAGKREGSLRERAADLGVGERVYFPGHVDDVPGLLSAADAFVLSSRFEGMPNNVLEAMAAGLPIVATTVGDVPDMLTDDRDALLCAPDDAGALAERMGRVLEDGDLAGRIAAAAAQRARTDYPVTTMVDRTAASLSAAVASGRAP
jgi:glycosyltransferase involved in cell wall biosynthesis